MVKGLGMLSTGLAGTSGRWTMHSYRRLSPRSVVAVGQRNYKHMHSSLTQVTEGFRHASVEMEHLDMHMHAVIKHWHVSIYL